MLGVPWRTHSIGNRLIDLLVMWLHLRDIKIIGTKMLRESRGGGVSRLVVLAMHGDSRDGVGLIGASVETGVTARIGAASGIGAVGAVARIGAASGIGAVGAVARIGGASGIGAAGAVVRIGGASGLGAAGAVAVTSGASGIVAASGIGGPASVGYAIRVEAATSVAATGFGSADVAVEAEGS